MFLFVKAYLKGFLWFFFWTKGAANFRVLKEVLAIKSSHQLRYRVIMSP